MIWDLHTIPYGTAIEALSLLRLERTLKELWYLASGPWKALSTAHYTNTLADLNVGMGGILLLLVRHLRTSCPVLDLSGWACQGV